jgi:hypothetical protein
MCRVRGEYCWGGPCASIAVFPAKAAAAPAHVSYSRPRPRQRPRAGIPRAQGRPFSPAGGEGQDEGGVHHSLTLTPRLRAGRL